MTPATTRRATVSVSIPAASLDKIEREAKKLGLSLSKYICQAAEHAAKVRSLPSPTER